MGTILYLILGYLLGMVFEPSLFSHNITLTHWDDIMVYAWLLAWPFMLLYHLLWPFFAPYFASTLPHHPAHHS